MREFAGTLRNKMKCTHKQILEIQLTAQIYLFP